MERNGCGRVLEAEHKRRTGTAMQRHIAAIESGNVTKTNVIGIRKALNHVDRIASGWSGNRSNATAEEVRAALDALERCKPIVRGELHESGVRLLTGGRYAKRLERVADKVAALEGFSLVGYNTLRTGYSVPVYSAWGGAGAFRFYVIPWQSADMVGMESGLHLESANV